jgi:hypothetical protein
MKNDKEIRFTNYKSIFDKKAQLTCVYAYFYCIFQIAFPSVVNTLVVINIIAR